MGVWGAGVDGKWKLLSATFFDGTTDGYDKRDADDDAAEDGHDRHRVLCSLWLGLGEWRVRCV